MLRLTISRTKNSYWMRVPTHTQLYEDLVGTRILIIRSLIPGATRYLHHDGHEGPWHQLIQLPVDPLLFAHPHYPSLMTIVIKDQGLELEASNGWYFDLVRDGRLLPGRIRVARCGQKSRDTQKV